jgi:putative thiamine transport system substrate-binding protein
MIRFAIVAAAVIGILAAAAPSSAADPDAADWPAVEAAARGTTVDFYAWGGETHINDYIAWAGEAVAARYGVTLRQVKLADTAEAVARVLAETVAGETRGAVDLVWINGENFAAMKEKNLLLAGRWVEKLPNRRLVDPAYAAAIESDFGVPTDAMEAPWGRAQLVFLYDSARTAEPPRSLDALLAFAAAHPGRFAYPQPPDFLGTAFLKQILLDRVPDPAVLRAPAGDGAAALVRDTLLPVLRELHRSLWRGGAAFPRNVAEVRRLFADGEIDLALTFNPSDAAAEIAKGLLPPTVRITAFDTGTLGNVHFVAIPHNAADKAGALVVANFLLSPEAQARKADPAVWGDPTVLAIAALPDTVREALPDGPVVAVPVLPEPHASWTAVIEAVWDEAFLR